MMLSPNTAAHTVDRPKIVNFLESTVDSDGDIPVLGFLSKLYLRRWMFAACLIIPTLASLGVTALTPPTWVARTEIMIRYGSSESAFLQNLIPDNRVSLSGSVVGEMVRSLPTLIETAKRYDIKSQDVYQQPGKVVFARLAELLHLGHRQDPSDADDDPTAVARLLQASLEESGQSGSSSFSSKTQPVEILAKDSPVPQALKNDELITLTLRSFNRDKVAAMTNGLAETVIDTYYQISAEDAHRSYEFLSNLAAQGDAALQRLQDNPDADLGPLSQGVLGRGANSPGNASPALGRLNNELAAAQAELVRAQQFFEGDSGRVQRVTAEIGQLKRLIIQQERLEGAKATLDEIKTRRFQALNTEDLYRKRLVPISVIEPAVTPERSPSAQILRFVVSGATGLVVGGVLGIALVIILGLLDQRLFTPSDVERVVGLSTVGWLPKLKTWRQKSGFLPTIEQHALWNAETGLLQTLSHLDAARTGEFGSTVAIASPDDNEGKSLVALILAQTLARPNRCKVLLVDADPARASITKHFRHMATSRSTAEGLPIRSMTDLVIPSGVPNLDILPVELMQEHENAGFYLSRIRDLFARANRTYDVTIVDTSSSSASGEALMCCMAAQSVLLVVRSGRSRGLLANGLLRKLREVAVHPQGVILNCRYSTLPPFFDRGV